MLQPNLEYIPKKKSRAPKIMAQILSTLFTAVMIIALITCITSDELQYVPFEKVNLYNTNYDDVYELKDLKVVSKYSSDEDFDYYLVLLPYKDETAKAASFRCSKYYFEADYKNNEVVDLVITVGVTVDTVDFYYDDILEAYNSAVDYLKNGKMKVASTELAFTFACEANDAAFCDYYDADKSGAVFSIAVFTALSIAGVVLMIISFRQRKNESRQSIYYQPSNHQGVYFDTGFDSRFK